MHIKHMHEMIEKLSEYGKFMVEAGVGCGNVNLCELGQIVDMIKDLACAEKEAREAKEMEKEEEDEKKENEYFLKMLKEEYGEEEGERRFYDNYRYANGRFAPKGRGSYRPQNKRRGYEEAMIPMDYRMTPEDYKIYPPEYWRDMDRVSKGVMYYTETGKDRDTGKITYNSNEIGNNPVSDTQGYSDGYNEGNRKGYEDGYRDGESRGRSQGGRRDGREGRSGQSRRSYMEAKEMNKGNTPQEKQEKMKELEKYMGELGSDITEMISDASNEEKTMLKSKLQTLVQKIQ